MDPATPADPPPTPPPPDDIPTVTPVEVPAIPTVQRTVRPRVVTPTVVAPPPEPPRARRAERPVPQYRDVPKVPSVLPLMVTMGVFAAIMSTSFGHGLYSLFTESDTLALTDPQIKDQLIVETVVVEGLDAAIVLLGLLVAGLPLARAAAGNRLITWAAAAPGFLLLLGVNLGYHQTLKWLVTRVLGPPDVGEVIDIGLQDGWLAILLVCVQPAVIEELFFRYLLYGHLRSHLGMNAAVWVSAVVFGMAHLGNVPGWPVLILLGAGLGYARAYSGSLALPIVLHFLHNLAVLFIDYATGPS